MTDNKTRPVTPTSDNKTKAFAGMEIQEDVLKLRIENKALYEIIEELKAQIEKMKKYLSCEYCKHYDEPYGCKECDEENKTKWKLKE